MEGPGRNIPGGAGEAESCAVFVCVIRRAQQFDNSSSEPARLNGDASCRLSQHLYLTRHVTTTSATPSPVDSFHFQPSASTHSPSRAHTVRQTHPNVQAHRKASCRSCLSRPLPRSVFRSSFATCRLTGAFIAAFSTYERMSRLTLSETY